MMMTNEIIQLDIEILSILVIIVLSFVGSIAKDYILLFKYNQRIKFGRIILSTITSSIFCYCLEPIAVNYLGFRGLVALSFLSGLVGFEVLTKISTIRGVSSLIKLIFFSNSTDIRDYTDVIGKDDEGKKEKVIIIYKDKDDDDKDKPKKDSS